MKITINLLPPEKKENFEAAKKLRIIIRIFSFVYLAFFVFFGFLFSCLMIIDFQISDFKSQEERLAQNDIYKRVVDTQDMIEKYHKQVVFLDGEYNKGQSFIYLLRNINSLLGEDAHLNGLSIDDEGMVIKGFSSKRENLLKFTEELKKIEGLGEVDAPISNFVSSENIDFEFSINFNSP